MTKHLTLLLFIGLAFWSCGSDSKKDKSKTPPSQQQIDSIRKSLSYEAEERWANYDVKYRTEDEVILVRVALYPISNEIAMNGYIDLIKDISQKHAPEHNCYIKLSKMGEVVKTKWIIAIK
jgi:hypothetical protein